MFQGENSQRLHLDTSPHPSLAEPWSCKWHHEAWKCHGERDNWQTLGGQRPGLAALALSLLGQPQRRALWTLCECPSVCTCLSSGGKSGMKA